MATTRKFFVSILLVCLLACSAQANIVYTTTQGRMGLIKISEALSTDIQPGKYSGASGSFAAHFYNEDGTSLIALIEPETNARASSGDKAYIFNASDLTSPIYDKPKILTGAYNTRSAAYSDNHRGLFFASSLNGEARVSEFNTENIELVRDFTYTASSDNAFMSTVLVNNSSVYCLVNKASEQDSMFIRFDGQLKDDIEGYATISAVYDSELIAFGKDSRILLGHSDGIDTVKDNKFVTMLSADNPVKAICRDNEGGFYFITQSDTGQQTLRHYTGNVLTASKLASGNGSTCKAIYYDKDGTKFAAFIMNDRIMIYDPDDDSLIKEFTSSELGGAPFSIASCTANTDSNKDSSNGCNATGAGLVSMLLAGIVLIHKNRR